jgi:hemolysin activation/secretion protein
VQVIGSTVLQPQITALIQKSENRDITFEELIELRAQITQLYVQNGYVTSGAFLPNNQDLSDGVVQIQVVEGELERIELSGLKRLRSEFVRKRLAIAAASPLNQQRLEKALQLLQLNPALKQVKAELTVGSRAGRSILKVRLQEAPAIRAGIAVENYQSPSLGAVQTQLYVAHNNFLGWGDRLSAAYGITSGLDTYDINYVVPIDAQDTTINFRFSNSDSRIVEDVFRDFDIRGDTQTFSLGVRQPLVRSPQKEIALGLALDLRRSQTYLLEDVPFSFSAGAENGKSKVTVIRFTQDFVSRKPKRAIAARSQLSLGINAFDATVNDSGTDGTFFSWLGQIQLVQRLSSRNTLIIRFNGQVTPDSLLALEQFSIGGVDTVRGYRQNQLVADNGILGSMEVRLPLSQDPNVLQVSPFFDIGTVWNNRNFQSNRTTIASLGLGVRWLIRRDLVLRVDYGIPLTKIQDRGDSLQDSGFYFSLQYQPF